MTKEDFDLMEKICKNEWRRLAETGDDSKNNFLQGFFSYCPACHIAVITEIELERRLMSNSNKCIHCPIDKWRFIAENESVVNVCTQDGQEYDSWFHADNEEDIKKWANIISKMHWSYLIEYDVIDSINALREIKETS